MNTELDSLEIRVQSEAQSAAAGLDKLIGSLTQLKGATKGVTGLSRIATGLERLNKALSGLQVNKKALGDLRSGLSGLSGIKTNLTTTANQINKLNSAMQELNVDDAKLQKLVTSLNGLGQVQKSSGLNSAISALRKLPEVSRSLSEMDMDEFARQIQRVTAALAPLASQMDRVSRGFSAFPARIQRVIQSNESLRLSNTRVANSFSLLSGPLSSVIAKLAAYGFSVQQVVSFLADSVMSINEYVENVNLFQVSMGEFYDEAFAYAQLVNEKLGVDPSQWMRTQGVFMSIANGFGVSREQAYALSEGLTELSYDLSSLYNEDVESSVSRLQSALAGEIEPIRRLGISITEATLKEYALSKGITESVESMTEQEKALLRTMKLMEGSATIGAIGDFARTLESPANALRVLKQELTQLSRSIGSVLIPILVQVLPYVQAVVSVLTDMISALAALVGFAMPEWDTTASWGAGITTGAENAADAMDTATDAAKALKTATLGIDELNILSPDTGSAGASGGAGLGSNWAEGLEIPDIWDKGALAAMTSKTEEIKQAIEKQLSKITATVSGASLALGAILALTGANIPVGLGLMAVGAAGLMATTALNWGSMDQSVSGVLTSITLTLSGFFLALGAVLAFAGVPTVGVPLMLLGAANLVAAMAINWNGMSLTLGNAVAAVSAVLGGAMLALGAIFAFSGANIPLGIALMASGLAVGISSVAINWSAMDPDIKNSVSRITAIVSGAFLALGAILTFSGVNPVMGIALLAGGALTLGTTIALNWSSMDAQLRESITSVTLVASAAFLALGAILTFSGAGIPLGIGLLAVGAAGLATAAALNWDSVISTVTTKLKEIGHIVGISLIALGAILLLSGVGAPLGLGMIIAGGVSLAAAVALNWDSIVTSVGTTLKNIGSKFLEFVNEWLSVDKWVELGTQAINGLFKGLSNLWGNVQEWGSELLSNVKDALGIHSPSVEFESIGEYSVSGLSNGFDKLSIVTDKFKAQLTIMLTATKAFASEAQAEIKKATDAMVFNFQSMASQSSLAIQSIVTALNSIPKSITTVHTLVATTSPEGSNATAKAYASGGYPDQGQLFLANEAGPELVGTIGGQTAVANTQQIVQGIASGVAQANLTQNDLLREQNELLRAILAKEGVTYLDGKRLYRSVEKASRNTGVMIMTGGMV